MSQSLIHPTAVVDPGARLGRGVRVGAFSFVGPEVELGDECVLHERVTLLGPSTFGARNEFHPGCVLGAAPQDLKYRGGHTRLEVGDDNRFRELVTVHRGTEIDHCSGGMTRIGNKNLLMVGVHVAHDAEIGNRCIIANNVLLAGHVRIEDCVSVGGGSAMHHFVTVGRNAYVGGMTRVTHDVPPYFKVQGYDQEVRDTNGEGMRRFQISDESIQAVREAYRMIYPRKGAPGRTLEALREIRGNGLFQDEHVRYLVEFLTRKLEVGVFGRVREAERTDSDADRAGFYRSPEAKT